MPFSGVALCRSSYCYAVLHLCRHWHAGKMMMGSEEQEYPLVWL